MLRKLYPFDLDNNLYSTFKVVLVSEGYTLDEKSQFSLDCRKFVKEFLEYTPFNLTRSNSNWISIYSAFEESSNQGVAIDVAANNRTAFDALYTTASHTLSFDVSKLTTWVDNAKYRYDGSTVNVNSLFGPGDIPVGRKGTLIVLLMPSLSTHLSGADYEHLPVGEEYYFVATTIDKYWSQLIIRSICKVLGLGDEYENEGTAYIEPVTNDDKLLPFNLDWFENTPTVVTETMKWYSLFSATQRVIAPIVHSKSDPNAIDETISTEGISWPKIEYWEGGGGYRSKVYRSAKDCLMRRKPASTTMPVRDHRIGLCPACKFFLRRVIN